jgi:histidinol dehydrogenase
MKVFNKPNRQYWRTLCQRPLLNQEDISETVLSLLEKVKTEGDKALIDCAKTFDKVELNSITVSDKEIKAGINNVSDELKSAIKLAYDNIYQFHFAQQSPKELIETTKGVMCWRESRAIEKVGLYIPGGSAPLFSTLLMLGIPAKIAGCKEVVICTPPQQDGTISDAILYTANLIGLDTIFKVGGAQAIGAMTYGTESIPQVYKVFGPGNQFVTKAKEICQLDGIGIDMPAGPSEVLIIADDSAIPAFVAADLLSQAEHGPDSQVILLSTSQSLIDETINELEKQLELLPRKEIAEKAIQNSKAILLENMELCFELSNAYAPEHLITAIDNKEDFLPMITNAGSVFIGNYSCESAGDYASGTNHTLPTNGYARQYSGVSLDSFQKKITFQELSENGILNIGPAVEIMAKTEQLLAHKNAMTLRLEYIKNKNNE